MDAKRATDGWCFAIINGRLAEIWWRKKRNGEREMAAHGYVERKSLCRGHQLSALRWFCGKNIWVSSFNQQPRSKLRGNLLDYILSLLSEKKMLSGRILSCLRR